MGWTLNGRDLITELSGSEDCGKSNSERKEGVSLGWVGESTYHALLVVGHLAYSSAFSPSSGYVTSTSRVSGKICLYINSK